MSPYLPADRGYVRHNAKCQCRETRHASPSGTAYRAAYQNHNSHPHNARGGSRAAPSDRSAKCVFLVSSCAYHTASGTQAQCQSLKLVYRCCGTPRLSSGETTSSFSTKLVVHSTCVPQPPTETAASFRKRHNGVWYNGDMMQREIWHNRDMAQRGIRHNGYDYYQGLTTNYHSARAWHPRIDQLPICAATRLRK